jgi:hypothetical protein
MDERVGIAPEVRIELDKKPDGAQLAYQADSVAVDAAGAVTDLNALLAKLRAAGLMALE